MRLKRLQNLIADLNNSEYYRLVKYGYSIKKESYHYILRIHLLKSFNSVCTLFRSKNIKDIFEDFTIYLLTLESRESFRDIVNKHVQLLNKAKRKKNESKTSKAST